MPTETEGAAAVFIPGTVTLCNPWSLKIGHCFTLPRTRIVYLGADCLSDSDSPKLDQAEKWSCMSLKLQILISRIITKSGPQL